MMPAIRIDDDVMEGLKKLAEPFTDTPNTVIRRLLQERGTLLKREAKPKVGPKEKTDTGTTQATYETFLNYVLARTFSGKGGKHQVTAAVIELMEQRHILVPADHVTVSTGETRAANTIAWARNALKESGYIKRDSERGIWELTEKGVERGNHLILPRKSAPSSDGAGAAVPAK